MYFIEHYIVFYFWKAYAARARPPGRARALIDTVSVVSQSGEQGCNLTDVHRGQGGYTY